jgi:hypothetical protein
LAGLEGGPNTAEILLPPLVVLKYMVFTYTTFIRHRSLRQ